MAFSVRVYILRKQSVGEDEYHEEEEVEEEQEKIKENPQEKRTEKQFSAMCIL